MPCRVCIVLDWLQPSDVMSRLVCSIVQPCGHTTLFQSIDYAQLIHGVLYTSTIQDSTPWLIAACNDPRHAMNFVETIDDAARCYNMSVYSHRPSTHGAQITGSLGYRQNPHDNFPIR